MNTPGYLLIACLSLIMPAMVHGIFPASAQDNVERLEILQLSISDDNNREVEIRFLLETNDLTGTLILNWYQDADSWGFLNIDLGGIPRDPSNNFVYELRFEVPAGSAPPFYIYLAYDDGDSRLQSNIHRALHLEESALIDICRNEVTLEWSQYRKQTHTQFANDPNSPGEPVVFGYYLIYIDGAHEATVPFDETTNSQSFTHEVAAPGDYGFRVQAVEHDDPQDPGRYSFSNHIFVNIDFPELQALDMVSASVEGDVGMNIAARAVGDPADFVFALERSPNAIDWEEVIRLEANPGGEISFFDAEAKLEEGPWYYRVSAYLVDVASVPCQEVAYTSDSLATIFLELLDLQMNESSLELDLGIEHPVQTSASTYQIEYMLSGDTEFSTYDGRFSFSKTHIARISLSHILPFSGDITFRVALPGAPDVFSNLVVVSIEPEVRIPNAFRPSSHIPENRVFQPEFIGFSPIDYVMSIYDRHGLLLFTTNNPATAWDGQLQHGGAAGTGSVLSDGAYMYHIRFTLPSGEPAERKGVVYLVR